MNFVHHKTICVCVDGKTFHEKSESNTKLTDEMIESISETVARELDQIPKMKDTHIIRMPHITLRHRLIQMMIGEIQREANEL